MELSIMNVIIVMLVCAMSAFLSHMGMEYFTMVFVRLFQSILKAGCIVLRWHEFMRGLSFIPLIATTAITTGVYGVAGFTFVYVAGYLSPNPIVAAVVGALIIFVEVMLLGLIGKFLGNFPSMRDASDNI